MKNVNRPELWTLLLGIDEKKITVVRYSRAQQNSLMSDVIALSGQGDFKQRLETAVYDNEPLLQDYGTIRIVIRPENFLLLPPDVTDEAEAEQLLRASLASTTGEAVLADPPGDGDPRVAMLLQDGVFGFLKRTFANGMVYCHLSPLIRAATELAGTVAHRQMHINLEENAMDVTVTGEGRLEAANTFRFTDINDAAYFALKMWETLSLDQRSDELLLTGKHKDRGQLLETLRKYVETAMPEMLPATALKLGDKVTEIPYVLIQAAVLGDKTGDQ
ncbi:MAG: DUF3822 family protein [Muribaculaceae bacterium]|nr:DUF3822 family protein [Muribaculaceae bacterium]